MGKWKEAESFEEKLVKQGEINLGVCRKVSLWSASSQEKMTRGCD